ncbi:MAG TPA: hypothetical protein V6D17_10150 [Candidatus Obscuribacterales bacterium]
MGYIKQLIQRNWWSLKLLQGGNALRHSAKTLLTDTGGTQARSTFSPRMYRQGDILLSEVTELPRGCVLVPSGDRVILALGESTGHAHAIAAIHADMYEWSGTFYVQTREGAVLRHEEHAPIDLPQAVFQVVRQRQFLLEGGISYVLD